MTRKTRPSAWVGGIATRPFMHSGSSWLGFGMRSKLSRIKIVTSGPVPGTSVRGAPIGKGKQLGDLREVICRVTQSMLPTSFRSSRWSAFIRNTEVLTVAPELRRVFYAAALVIAAHLLAFSFFV